MAKEQLRVRVAETGCSKVDDRAPDRLSAATSLQPGAAARSRQERRGQISQGNRESSRAICLPADWRTDKRAVIVSHSWIKQGQTGVLDCGSALAGALPVADVRWTGLRLNYNGGRRRARPGMTDLQLQSTK
ncbi:hypothetical protein QR685DRAFT_567406 [Neurospora intermedia]|uniref:Uncharacterized protein n=1 Tax=Neurospora intermedia TaxID=5142 RepID=A0ABR3DP83_NEUIN